MRKVNDMINAFKESKCLKKYINILNSISIKYKLNDKDLDKEEKLKNLPVECRNEIDNAAIELAKESIPIFINVLKDGKSKYKTGTIATRQENEEFKNRLKVELNRLKREIQFAPKWQKIYNEQCINISTKLSNAIATIKDTEQRVRNQVNSTITKVKNSKVDNMLGTILGGAVKLVGGIASIAKLKTLSDRINEVGERIAGSEYLRKMCFGLRKYLLVLIYGAIWFGGGKQYLRRKAQEAAASGIAPEDYGANAAAIQTVAGEPVSAAESTDYLYLNTFLDTLMMINEAEEAIAPIKNSENVSNPLGINLNDNNEKLTSSMVSRSYVVSTKLMNDNEFISLINRVDPKAFMIIKDVAQEAQMNKNGGENELKVAPEVPQMV